MINDCDGILGATLAVEGTSGYWTLINGPGGCRSRLQNLLREQIHNYEKEDPRVCSSCFMSRQSRAPCTFLNPDDLIMGSGKKITEGLDSVLEIIGGNVVLIETMVASIQVVEREISVENCKHPERIVLSDQDLSSMSFAEGFDDMMLKLVEHIGPEREQTDAKKVNILGYGVFDSGWENGKEEIRHLLELIGVEVIAFIGCDSSENILASGAAAANISIHPELSHATAKYYEDKLGIPTIIPTGGSPIGYVAIRSFIEEISEFLKIDPKKAFEEISSREKKVFGLLANCDRVGIGLHGYGMAIKGLPSDIIPTIAFMRDLLGLVPESVEVYHTDAPKDLTLVKNYLDSIDCGFAYGSQLPKVGLRAIFTDGLSARYLKEDHPECACIGYMMPFEEKQNFINRSIVGLYGCQYLVDKVINGQDLFVCDQPVGVDFR